MKPSYRQPHYGELAAIILLGILQPLVEFAYGARASTFYDVFAVGIGIVYAAYCLRTYSDTARAWGLRTDNLKTSLVPHLTFAALGSIALLLYGWHLGSFPFPTGFWYVLALYPFWAFAQQFALQHMVVGNLATLIPHPIARALLVTTLFALAHIPSVPLTILAGLGGFFFTYLYHKYPNLYAISIAHGILGSLVFYAVMQRDQWSVLMRYIGL